MSIVIVGGNERMTRNYIDLCNEYNSKAKVYSKLKTSLRDFGNPDLLVLFTDTISHKALRCAMNGAKGKKTIVARAHSSSMAALKSILEEYAV